MTSSNPIWFNRLLLAYYTKAGLYDFVQTTQQRHSDCQVYLIEDNAGAHRKAARLLEQQRAKRGIVKVDWVPNSPDLHPIENVWSPLQEYLEPTFENLNDSSKASKDKAEAALRNA